MTRRAEQCVERRAALGLALSACAIAAWASVQHARVRAELAAEAGRQQRIAAALAGDAGALAGAPLAWSAFGVAVALGSDAHGVVAAPHGEGRQP